MIGAIIGDMVGSVYDENNIRTKNFDAFNINNRMTDDSFLTIEVAKVLLKYYPFNLTDETIHQIQGELIARFTRICLDNPYAGWGARFFTWCHLPRRLQKPYNSYGNGAAMRVSPVAWLAKDAVELKALSKIVTEVTHNHPEGLKGAEAVAMAVYLALQGKTKDEIKEYIVTNYYPRLSKLSYSDLVAHNTFDVTCQGSVPEAIYSFLIATDFEDALRTAVSIGGDSDTIASITGAIAEAYYHRDEVNKFMSDFMYLFFAKELETLLEKFYEVSGNNKLSRK